MASSTNEAQQPMKDQCPRDRRVWVSDTAWCTQSTSVTQPDGVPKFQAAGECRFDIQNTSMRITNWHLIRASEYAGRRNPNE